MRSLIARYRRHRAHISRGQSLTEFALVLPVFLLIVLIGLDFGRLFLGYVSLQQSARIAANYASVHPTAWDNAGSTPTKDKYQTLIRNDAATINCQLPLVGGVVTAPDPVFTPGQAVGDQAQVTISCDFDLITPFIGAVLPNPLPLTAFSSFPIRFGEITGDPGGGGLPPAPVADFSAGQTVCTLPKNAPCSIDFTDLSTNAPISWAWDFGDNGTSTLQNPSHSYSAPGLYTVSLTASNLGGGDTETKTNYIQIKPTPPSKPVANFSGTPRSGDAALLVTFTDSSSNSPTSWSWTFGDGGTDTSQNPTHNYATPGTYSVSLTVTNAGGSDTKTANNYIVVTNPNCVVPKVTGTKTNASAVDKAWNKAGFTQPVIYNPAVPPNYTVGTQNPAVGQTRPCKTTVLTVTP